MNTKKQRAIQTEQPIHSIKENINGMVNCAWQLAKGALWHEHEFQCREERDAKKFIKHLLCNQADPYKGYLEICQRILLIYRELKNSGKPVIKELPSQYFNPGNNSGFALSEKLFTALQQKRIKEPLHDHAMKAFCEAILDMTEEPAEETFAYWLNWFNEKDVGDEYGLFYSCRLKTDFGNL